MYPTDSSETQRLLDDAEQGDATAFGRLFARHERMLERAVGLRLSPRLRSRLDVADIVQEVHVEALGQLQNYLRRRPMSFRLWLRKTAEQRIQKAHRRYFGAAARDLRREVALPERSSVLLLKAMPAASLRPDDEMTRVEQVQRLHAALAQLPDADREILLMRTFEGLSYAEIADHLELEAAAARKRYGRALLRLRTLFGGDSTGTKA